MCSKYIDYITNFYLQEAKAQAEYALISFDLYLIESKKQNIKKLFYHLHHFLIHSVAVDRVLQKKPNRPDFQGKLDLTTIDLKPLRRLRNHLEHFDERLDRFLAEFPGHAFFDMNIVTGTIGFPGRAFLRAIDGDLFRFSVKLSI